MIRAALLSLVLFAAPVQLAPIKPRTAPTHKRLVLVLDVSCSMDGRLNAALSAVREVTDQPVDDLEVAAYAFATRHMRWPTTGYRVLPDADAMAEAEAWLLTVRPLLGGGTQPVSALAAAAKEPRPRTIVVASDGEFPGEPGLARGAAKEDCLVFAVAGAGAGAGDKDSLARLSLLAGETGGLYRVEAAE